MQTADATQANRTSHCAKIARPTLKRTFSVAQHIPKTNNEHSFLYCVVRRVGPGKGGTREAARAESQGAGAKPSRHSNLQSINEIAVDKHRCGSRPFRHHETSITVISQRSYLCSTSSEQLRSFLTILSITQARQREHHRCLHSCTHHKRFPS